MDKQNIVNHNDIIRLELKINGKTIVIHEKICNTQADFNTIVATAFAQNRLLKLVDITRMG